MIGPKHEPQIRLSESPLLKMNVFRCLPGEPQYAPGFLLSCPLASNVVFPLATKRTAAAAVALFSSLPYHLSAMRSNPALACQAIGSLAHYAVFCLASEAALRFDKTVTRVSRRKDQFLLQAAWRELSPRRWCLLLKPHLSSLHFSVTDLGIICTSLVRVE